jgi:hypothetical protein
MVPMMSLPSCTPEVGQRQYGDVDTKVGVKLYALIPGGRFVSGSRSNDIAANIESDQGAVGADCHLLPSDASFDIEHAGNWKIS